MKKLYSTLQKFLVVGVLMPTLGTSCSKSRTCDCQVTYRDAGGGSDTRNYSYTIKATKKNAESTCSEFEKALKYPPSDMLSGVITSDARCTLK